VAPRGQAFSSKLTARLLEQPLGTMMLIASLNAENADPGTSSPSFFLDWIKASHSQ
jgi:hypothetical protein